MACASQTDLHVFFPPQWSPFQPFLGAPSLKAYLEMQGFSMRQTDLNLPFYLQFIGRNALDPAIKQLYHYARTLPDEFTEYRGRAITAISVLEEHDKLLKDVEILHSPHILNDIPGFRRSVEALRCLLGAFSAAQPVIEIGISSFSASRVLESPQRLLEFIANEDENPFIAFYRESLKDIEKPRFLGISIIGAEQIVPGLSLCKMLREQFPNTEIIIGGSVFSRIAEKDSLISMFFGSYFDFIYCFEGETTIKAFLESHNPRKDRVPNLVFQEHGRIVSTEPAKPLSIKEMPTPDFNGLPLGDYLTPDLVLPLLTSRGCYWGKCAFCHHGMIYQERFRMRDPEQVAEDVEHLNTVHGARHFAFNDEALPPKMFRRLPDHIPAGKYSFTALYRFESSFTSDDFRNMAKIGFQSFYIGMESASDRVLTHMLKGNNVKAIISNLRDANEAGIWNHVFVFFGFPTETEAEARETMEFLFENCDIIHSEGTGLFSLEHNAPVYTQPQSFGVAEVKDKPNRILDLYYNYETVSGLDAQAAEELLSEFRQGRDAAGYYQSGRWIPREYLLLLLGRYGRDTLKTLLETPTPSSSKTATVHEMFKPYRIQPEGKAGMNYVVNRKTNRVFEVNEDTVLLFQLLDRNTNVSTLLKEFPSLTALLEHGAAVSSPSSPSA